MANLTYLKGVRTRYRNVLDSSIEEGRNLLKGEIEECVEKIKSYNDKVESQSEKLAVALGETDNEQTESIVNDDCELCSDAIEVYLDLKEYKGKLESARQKQNIKPVAVPNEQCDALIELQQNMQRLMAAQIKQQQDFMNRQDKKKHPNTVKLPKLEMISFGGDKTRWVEFWDSFQSSVHDNSSISNVDKFNYLKSKLFGEARRAVMGIALSNENYTVALEVLKDRFGNTQEIIDLHYNRLINLVPATK
ncbi:uncharacterized protein LOC123530907 [Mercenaria mercenaria]|uniref:uncharacterized protein LOC123530907 n=1 Tax=Mercenaria mercenaria TaxID=6596 RepID=UPI00234E8D7A|nr:uncharacterized protein LOC123530907 [Mercenaria mercenaria]